MKDIIIRETDYERLEVTFDLSENKPEEVSKYLTNSGLTLSLESSKLGLWSDLRHEGNYIFVLSCSTWEEYQDPGFIRCHAENVIKLLEEKNLKYMII